MNYIPSNFTNFAQQRLAAEVLACVIGKLFPNVQLLGGDIHPLGFFYDFYFQQPLSEGMFELIEIELHRFIKDAHSIRYTSMMRENAQSFFLHHGYDFLAEKAVEELSNILDLIQIGDYYSLCPPLGLSTTLEAGYIKLLDCIQKNLREEVPLTRLVGTCRPYAKELKSFLKTYDCFLKKKDHRILGHKLNLFSISESMGDLGVTWHPKGIYLQSILKDWLKDCLPWHRNQIATPLILKQGFLTPSQQNLEPLIFEGEKYQLRSSSVNAQLDYIGKFLLDSEELPWRIYEYATVYRHFPEHVRWGLFSICTYLNDYETICCERKQVIPELISSLHFIEQIITIFGFEGQWVLVASRHKSLQARQEQEAIGWLKTAFQEYRGTLPLFPEVVEEENETPRLELRIRDAMGREWPTSELGIASIKNANFLQFKIEEQQSHLVILTRQIFGSLDRFIALLLERYEGELPLWLTPEQVRVMTIGEANRAYALQVSQSLQRQGFRVGFDGRQTKLGVKVHEAKKENVPYLVLIGEQERIKQQINVRKTEKFNQNQSIDLETFSNKLYRESRCPLKDGDVQDDNVNGRK